ncbi:MAG: molybdopterin-dependent oxidoreductase [Methylophilaceae bacterium]
MSTELFDETFLTTCPRDCYDSCGILVTKKNGAILQVRGDPNHQVSQGKLCEKCSIAYNHEWIDKKSRLSQPLRRVGPKGSGQYEPISWDDACAEIASRLKAIIATDGPQTIYNAHYTGTISLLGFMFPMRFFNKLGATEVNPDTICNMAGHVALGYMYGNSLNGFDPRMIDAAKCVIVWGANPAACGPHVYEHWFKKAKVKTVVIDPIRTQTAMAADIHLQPFPGSDAALAYAMLHVIQRQDLVNHDFIAKYTLGWDEIEPLLADCTPAWGERVTGVPAALIEEVAILYANGPSLLWLGQALQRQSTGGNIMRACALLPAVTGNIAKLGAGFLYLNWDLPLRGIDDAYITAPHLGIYKPASVSQMDLATHLEDQAKSKALFAWNINIAASNPEQTRLKAALLREDLFTVVVDLFATDTTAYADIILPAASFLEFDDLVAGYFHLTLSAQVKVMEPLGSSLPNPEIFRHLAKAMGYNEPELHETDASILAHLMKHADIGESFESLARKGSTPVPLMPRVQFGDLKFGTPSGLIELASSSAEANGHPRIPLPIFDAKPKAGYLRMLSPAGSWSLNSSFGNVAKVSKQSNKASIFMHPKDATDCLVTAGEMALVSNDIGQLKLNVVIDASLPRGVVLVHKGRWPKNEPENANVNILNPGHKSDMGESTAVHGIEVSVKPL